MTLLLVEVGLLATRVNGLVRKAVLMPGLLQLELLLHCGADCVADFSEQVLVGLLTGVLEHHWEYKRMAPSLDGLLLQRLLGLRRLLWLRSWRLGGLRLWLG